MSMLPALPEDGKVKSFWNRPEGTTGYVALVALAVMGYLTLPAILSGMLGILVLGTAVVGQTITLAILCLILAAMFYVVTNRKFITLCQYMFKSSMRFITSKFIEIDPIGIMEGYIDSLKEKRTIFLDKKRELSGQLRTCKERITKANNEADESLSLAGQAKQKGNASQMVLHTRNHGRLTEYVGRMKITEAKMQMLYEYLNKYAEAADVVIQDITSEVRVKKDERDMILTSSSAIKSVMSILHGGTDERELFDQAMEFTANEYGQKLGEIEDFMEMSESILQGIDLKNGAWEAKALKELEKLEAKNTSLLLGGEKRLIIEQAQTSIPLNSDISYDRYFTDKK